MEKQKQEKSQREGARWTVRLSKNGAQEKRELSIEGVKIAFVRTDGVGMAAKSRRGQGLREIQLGWSARKWGRSVRALKDGEKKIQGGVLLGYESRGEGDGVLQVRRQAARMQAPRGGSIRPPVSCFLLFALEFF
jgi:hypothetical protein